MPDETTIDTILRTKLHRPPVPGDYVHRPRLLEYLDKRRERPLTLVSAPAGYGKSVLISCWLETCDIPNAWLSLDEHDNDLYQFMIYFLAAIQTMFPDAVSETTTLVNASSLPPVSVLARRLANELDSIERNFILMLDDIHCIQQKSVHDFLTELMQYPPRPMHLVLGGRSDPSLPIASYRANNRVSEVRLFDLRFTSDETMAYLHTVLGEQIKEDIAARLAERFDGWITGLRLAVLATRKHDNVVSKLLELKGTTAHVTEYLINEVLDIQPSAFRHYFLSTSILNRFSAPLCDALWAPDSERGEGVIDGAAFIAKLRKDNLFLIALDMENRWFRYHHLFQNLLRSQLMLRCNPEEIAALHSRAGEWYAKNNFIDEGIEHKLAADDVNGAIQLFEQNRPLMLNSNRWYVFDKWLSMFPDNVLQRQPELMLAQAWVHYFQYKHALIPPILDSVESLLSDDPKEQSLYGEIYLFKGVYCFMRGDFHSLEYIEGALERLPVTYPMVRGFAEVYFGLSGQMQGQKDRVVHALSELLSDPSLELSRKLRLMTARVWIHIISGELTVAARFNRQLMDAAAHNAVATFIAWSSYNQGLIHFCRNELDMAIHYFSQAIENNYLMLRRADADCMAGLAVAYQATQQTDKATATLERLYEFIQPFDDLTLTDIAHSCGTRLSLMKGETAFVSDVLSINKASQTDAMAIWLEVPVITQCRALIAEGSDNCLQEVEKKLQELLRLNQAHHNTCQMIRIMALQALAIHRQGRLDESLDVLEQAVAMAEPDGWIRPFVEPGSPMINLLKGLQKRNVAVDYIKKLLSAFGDDKQVGGPEAADRPSASAYKPLRPSAPPQPLVEPLTNRELDVLELLAQRLQNKEIADKLFVSTETVKAHLKNIYQKLNVSKRREAVSRAMDLGILTRR